jgi:tetratricopeptide (TPR) repeat protein
MNKYLLLLVTLPVVMLSCYLPDDCPENIHKLPMYGRVKKCAAQIRSDSVFLSTYKNDPKKAAVRYVKRGWDYIREGKLDTAMFRFNQAWMLDSLNADVYWGFANLLGMQQKYEESVLLFERSLSLKPTDFNVYRDAAVSNGNLFRRNQNSKYQTRAIQYLKTADRLSPGNARIKAQLAGAYYFSQIDSARKYLKMAEKLDPAAVDPQMRAVIMGKQ